MSENLETMETINNEEINAVDDMDYTEVEGGSGKVIGLVVAGLGVAATLGVAAYKKIKDKKDEKPKKKRKKLMWVEVDDEVEEPEVIESDVDDDAEDSEE